MELQPVLLELKVPVTEAVADSEPELVGHWEELTETRGLADDSAGEPVTVLLPMPVALLPPVAEPELLASQEAEALPVPDKVADAEADRHMEGEPEEQREVAAEAEGEPEAEASRVAEKLLLLLPVLLS